MNQETLARLLDIARWAPSGDNTQPWRFEIVAPDRIAVHGHDTRDTVLYDFDGHASHMAHGALLETLRIAATRFGLSASWQIRSPIADRHPIYDVTVRSSGETEHPLAPFIEKRCVQRRIMRAARLTEFEKAGLAAAVGPDFSLTFFETLPARWRVGMLLWHSARIRLTCPEAYLVHRDVIDWNARFSEERIPDQAIGVDPVTARLMHWVMKSWPRVDFFNRYLFGTVPPRIELDFLPALGCSAHVLARPTRQLGTVNDYVAAGAAFQRLWLTATSISLHLQPEMTPLIFHWYADHHRPVSARPSINQELGPLAKRFDTVLGSRPGDPPGAFLCRIGKSHLPRSRSLRRSLDRLLWPEVAAEPRQGQE